MRCPSIILVLSVALCLILWPSNISAAPIFGKKGPAALAAPRSGSSRPPIGASSPRFQRKGAFRDKSKPAGFLGKPMPGGTPPSKAPKSGDPSGGKATPKSDNGPSGFLRKLFSGGKATPKSSAGPSGLSGKPVPGNKGAAGKPAPDHSAFLASLPGAGVDKENRPTNPRGFAFGPKGPSDDGGIRLVD